MELKPGTRFRSQVCETEVVVVKSGAGGVLACGGVPVVPPDTPVDAAAAVQAGGGGGTLLGKRYTDESSGVEILCVKPGAGSLSIDGRLLGIKTTKALPASD